MTAGHRYPLAPLMALTGWTFGDIRKLVPGSTRSPRVRQEGVTEVIADRLAVAAGYHPYQIWPEMADDVAEDASVPCVECGGSFIPSREGHRFCSRQCYETRYKRERYRRDPGHAEEERVRSRVRYRESVEYYRAYARMYYVANRAAVRERQNAAARRSRTEP